MNMDNLIATNSDRGNALVILSKLQYTEKIYDFIWTEYFTVLKNTWFQNEIKYYARKHRNTFKTVFTIAIRRDLSIISIWQFEKNSFHYLAFYSSRRHGYYQRQHRFWNLEGQKWRYNQIILAALVSLVFFYLRSRLWRIQLSRHIQCKKYISDGYSQALLY